VAENRCEGRAVSPLVWTSRQGVTPELDARNQTLAQVSPATDVQAQIAEDFAMFSDWSERYQYLIDLAKSLPVFDAAQKTEVNLLKGCQSQVFVYFGGAPERLDIFAISDSSIVSGLISLVLRVYSGLSPAQVVATEPSFIEHIGLSRNLSSTRKNGLAALIATIKAEAARRLG
jgi:cysteine desulfuration protein SufE